MLTFLFDGIDRTGNIPIPDTGGWQSYTTLTKSVQLPAGVQVMRVLVTSEGASGFAGNLNYIDFTAAGSATTTSSAQSFNAPLSPTLTTTTTTTKDAAGSTSSASALLDMTAAK